MSVGLVVASLLAPHTVAEASRRIDDWYLRGYVLYSDLATKSTHLRRHVSGPGVSTLDGGAPSCAPGAPFSAQGAEQCPHCGYAIPPRH